MQPRLSRSSNKEVLIVELPSFERSTANRFWDVTGNAPGNMSAIAAALEATVGPAAIGHTEPGPD
jgi:hypothetical protein